MANLTYAQLEGQWIQAGGSSSLAPLMAAIAEAESGGNPGALNATDNGGKQSSFGLWQISNGTHTPPSPNWNNPLVNAQLAVAKYQSQGLGAWGTYTSGAYKAYLSGSTTPDTSPLTGDASLTAATSATAAASTTSNANCAWAIGFGSLPGSGFLAGVFGSTGLGSIASGEVCIISKPQVRGLVGVAVLGLGLLIAFDGLLLIAQAAALPVAERVLGAVVGGGTVGRLGRLASRAGGASSGAAAAPAAASSGGEVALAA